MNFKSASISRSLLLSCLLGFMPTVAAAADQARTLFQKGTDLFAGEKYEEAVEAFRAAYAVRPSWKLLFNIGQAEAAARRYGQALEAFEQYLAEAGDEISLERQQEVQNEARRLREMVGTLMVTAPSGAMILVDDLERGTAPMPDGILVSAGVSHGLKAVIDGKVVAESEARVRVGGVGDGGFERNHRFPGSARRCSEQNGIEQRIARFAGCH